MTSHHNLLPEPVDDFPQAAKDLGLTPLGMTDEARPYQIRDPMEYIDTDDPAKIARYRAINQAAWEAYAVFLARCPQSAERTLAIRKLQEARMWANAAIAFDGKTYPL